MQYPALKAETDKAASPTPGLISTPTIEEYVLPCYWGGFQTFALQTCYWRAQHAEEISSDCKTPLQGDAYIKYSAVERVNTLKA